MASYRNGSIVTLIAVMALLVAAFGGGSSDDGGSDPTSATTAASGSNDGGGTTETTAAANDDDSGGSDDGDRGDGDADEGGDLSLVPGGETDILGNPAGQGFVELDGVRYDFILSGACQKIFGGLQGSGPLADGSDGGAHTIIPPEDWETDTAAGWDPPLVQVDIGDDTWQAQAGSEHFVGGANVTLTLEQSSVTAFTSSGSKVAGDAVFYMIYNHDEIETVTGSFEFYCP